MKDYGISVLEQYQMEVYSTRRIRGAVLCETDKGLFLLKEAAVPCGRLPVLVSLYKQLNEGGFELVDTPLANKEGAYLSLAEDGTKYIVKRWFSGRECDVRKESELAESARHLARLHKVMRVPEEDPEGALDFGRRENLSEEYRRHNRELRKVREFVRKRSVKGAFETAFLKAYDPMHSLALTITERLECSEYGALFEEAMCKNALIHGDYNYHNILIGQQGIAVTGFEHATRDVQLADFYYFLRKAMEKHHFDEWLGEKLVSSYDSVSPLTKGQREYLAIRLAYPEKFWKIANIYYHSNKAWIPEKNVEKLQLSISQMEEKKKFLANIFAFHL